MSKITLTVNEKEFPVNYCLLSEMAEKFPHESQYYDLAKALLDLKIPSLTLKLLKYPFLKQSDLNALWEEGDLNIRRALLEKDAFALELTEQQVEDVIQSNDPVMLKNIIDALKERFSSDEDEDDWEDDDEDEDIVDVGESEVEIPANMEKLIEFIHDKGNASVRQELYEIDELPDKFKPGILDVIELGLKSSVWVENLQDKDLPLLEKLSLKDLKYLAFHVDEIANSDTLHKAANWLAAYPDNGVRYQLAKNVGTPKETLEILANDTDPDIALEAKDTLESL